MIGEKQTLILAILLINKGEPLNNSYKLIHILELKFHTVNSKKMLDEIKEKQNTKYDLIKGVHYYTLTSAGKEFILNEKEHRV